jgi:Dyp-type peroxidase family
VTAAAGPQVDQSDLQGNVLCGYGFRHALYLFVQFHRGADAREWLSELLDGDHVSKRPCVTDAVPWNGSRPKLTLNVAFSFDGLARLGVPPRLLDSFPEDFREGMEARSHRLGDPDPGDAGERDEELREERLHALVTVFARHESELRDLGEALRKRIQDDSGLELVHEQDAHLLGGRFGRRGYAHEHFGFADGFAQPTIAGNAGPSDRRGGGTPVKDGQWEPLAPGEFVLGYEDEDGILPAGPPGPLGRSGSYTVVRKLHQDVKAFRDYVAREAKVAGLPEEWLSAKIAGRWRDGAPVSLTPDHADPELAGDNDFRFGDDEGGLRCPLGAHIRRANPRDAFGWEGRLTRRHRIIRRGMPYGQPPIDASVPDQEPRGLMFVCYQASIARQFELIQGSWLRDGDAFGLGADEDLLTTGAGEQGKMTVQGRPPAFLPRNRPFVTLRGGGYFFTPGIGALRALASRRWE